MAHAFSFQEMLLFLQHKQMNVLCDLYTLWNARLGSRPKEGLDIFPQGIQAMCQPSCFESKGRSWRDSNRGKRKYTATWRDIWWQWLLASCGGTWLAMGIIWEQITCLPTREDTKWDWGVVWVPQWNARMNGMLFSALSVYWSYLQSLNDSWCLSSTQD